MRPEFSILIPTFNQARYLPKALASAVVQRGSDVEILVVDNASTDGTADILRRLHDPRVRVVRQPKTVPKWRNWQTALDQAQGTYCLWLPSDDLLAENALEAIRGAVWGSPRPGVVFGPCLLWNEPGGALDFIWPYLGSKSRVFSPSDFIRHSLHISGSSPIAVPGCAFLREGGDGIPRILEGFPLSFDACMWYQFAWNHSIRYVPNVLGAVVHHPGTSSWDVAKAGGFPPGFEREMIIAAAQVAQVDPGLVCQLLTQRESAENHGADSARGSPGLLLVRVLQSMPPWLSGPFLRFLELRKQRKRSQKAHVLLERLGCAASTRALIRELRQPRPPRSV